MSPSKRPLVLKIDGPAWNQGFADGLAATSSRLCPYQHGSTERLSWLSGYIEGDAARLGYDASYPASPWPRLDAPAARPSAAALRSAAPVPGGGQQPTDRRGQHCTPIGGAKFDAD